MNSSKISINFPIQSIDQWKDAAKTELGGLNPDEKLRVEKKGLTISPYYHEINPILPINALTPSNQEFLGARAWSNMPLVVVHSATEANLEALHHLNHGADGILFDLANKEINAAALLNQIELPYCSVAFQASHHNTSFFNEFKAACEKKYDVGTIRGAIFWEEAEPIACDLFSWPGFSSLGTIVTPNDSCADELANTLKYAIVQAEKIGAHSDFCAHVGFLMHAEHDFFLNIAKIKALKHLWSVIGSAYQTPTNSVYVHMRVNSSEHSVYEPHGSMISQTSSSLAAVLGGCDGLTVVPAAEDLQLTSRIARNISSILRDESHLSHVSDPTHGSFYLESLTAQLVVDVWKKFQQLMS